MMVCAEVDQEVRSEFSYDLVATASKLNSE